MKIEIESNIIRHLLKDVYFINGTAYAGKSTMVKILAQKHDGICCGENYHDVLMGIVDPAVQPNLAYFDTMSGWQEFIGRSPDVYEDWIEGVSREAAEMEIALLLGLASQGKKIFVDTNIPLEILKEISDERHIALMLSPQSMSVDRFFDREDPEKRFLLEKIQEADDPDAAMENFRRCIARINSAEHYEEFAQSGLFTYIRREDSTIEEAVALIEKHFDL